MKTTLHITNGDSVIKTFEDAALEGEYLPWRDALSEGPVPDIDPVELQWVRANFLKTLGHQDHQTIELDLAKRDAKLMAVDHYDQWLLWFEHDLYDQLQLLQILDALSQLPESEAIELICIGRFPGFKRFRGLGELDATQLMSLLPARTKVTDTMLRIGSEGWKAFRSDNPTEIERFLQADTSSLPFLDAALLRFLRQYPSVETGLSENEALILKKVTEAPITPFELFASDWEGDRATYLGDLFFFQIVERLQPLMTLKDGRKFEARSPGASGTLPLVLTKLGNAVLDHKQNALDILGIDRWLGGVHLDDPRCGWRWDESRRRLQVQQR